MDLAPLLALSALLGLVVGLAIYLLMYSKQQGQAGGTAQEQEQQQPAQAAVGRRGDRMRGRQLRQRAQQQQQAAAAAAAARQGSDSGEGSDDDDNDEGVPLNRRDRRRAERAEARAAEAAAREARGAKISAYEDKRRAKEAEREARERAQGEEIARAAAEKQRAEDEEAAKWMGMISVEETGTLEAAASAEDQGLLGRFVEYLMARKMVPIEDAASEFGLRSSEVVDRIQGLEAMGRLTGVMDERGKFIYISREEMAAVAQHIRSAGRVSIAALAARSAELIDLEPRSAADAGAAGRPLGVGPAIDFDDVLGEGGGGGD